MLSLSFSKEKFSKSVAMQSSVDIRRPQTRLGHLCKHNGTRCFFGSKIQRKIHFSLVFCSLIRIFAGNYHKSINNKKQ